MIAADQPTIFPESVVAGVSSLDDGNMKRAQMVDPDVEQNRARFVHQLGIDENQLVVPVVTYETDNFLRYKTYDTQGSQVDDCDGLVVTRRNVAAFLPLADCTGAILYDPEHHILMVTHLGRHSTEQYGGVESVRYMQQQCGTDPYKLLAWLSPSPGSESYPLWQFDNRSFRDVLIDQLTNVGVQLDHIEASMVDTSTSPHYFSHSEFLRGNRPTDGRYAVVAMLQ